MRPVDPAGLAQDDLSVGVLLGKLSVADQAGYHVTRPLLLIHILEVVEAAECLILPVCVLDREVDAHSLQLLHDLGSVVTVRTLEVFPAADDCVSLDAVPMEVPATAGDLETPVLRSVLPDLLVADDAVSVWGHWEPGLGLPLPVGPTVDPHVLIELERRPDLHPAGEVGRHRAVLSAAAEDNQKLKLFFSRK